MAISAIPGSSRAAAVDEERMREIFAFTARTLKTARPSPFGALIVNTRTGERLMRATNAVLRESDPSAHGETRTVRLACKKLKRPSLAGFTMYSTCEPCAMCMANALWARLDRVVYGATIEDANRYCLQIHIPAREVSRRSDMPCLVDGPVLRDLCNTLFTHPNMQKAFRTWSTSKKKSKKTDFLKHNRLFMEPKHIDELRSLVADSSRVILNPQIVEQLSRDFYWYSPVLRKQLDGKLGEVVVQPLSAAEIQKVLRYSYANNLPVTARGAGTGNYGQAVPLEGGVVMDLSRMDRIEEIQPEGVAVCQPGVRLGELENEARKSGWELRCYPSTIIKASVGGFLGGGSGGIGTVAHGGLRDFQTVRALEVVTMEPEPRIVLHEGEAIHEILHAWGTNGIITRIWLALTPAVEWSQCVVALDTFAGAFDFSEKIATEARWIKRLVTVFEWPIPSFFTPIRQYAPEGKTLIFFMIASSQLAELEAAARGAGGVVTHSGVYPGLNARPLLSDYTWNHTTLWAMRSDEAYTYLQCGFNPDTVREQMRKLRERFGQEILFHMEFMKNGEGRVIPGAIPVVYYKSEERLNDMIHYCREIGVFVANPHVNNVEGGGRYRADNVQLLAKHRYDPKGLLNPGKMVTFHSESAAAEATTK